MRYTTYGAVVIGSKNILLKVYEISAAGEIREIDRLSHEYEMGKEAYITRQISFPYIEEICGILNEFKQHMKEYDVKQVDCFATSAIRQAKNRITAMNHIRIRTGFTVKILSNSELRFLMYKGIQISGVNFDSIIQKNTALLDVGSGSVQISLFDKEALYMTQNLAIGTAKVRELLETVEHNTTNYISLMEEYIRYSIESFKIRYLKEKDIKNVLAIGDEIRNLKRIAPELSLRDTMNYEEICYIYKKVKKATYQDLALRYGLSVEEARMILPSVIIYKLFLEGSKADTIYICDTNLCDGGVVDYAEKAGKLVLKHDFYQDIIASAKYIGKRYRYNRVHALYVRDLACEIFEKTIKYHGLGKRDRLILEIAAILHDIGKYVNLNAPGQSSYQLIMSTEIMGISHREREEIANIVLYTSREIPDGGQADSAFWNEEYLRISQLAAILELANALGRDGMQKFKNRTIARKGKELVITVETGEDIALDISLFSRKAKSFSEAMGITPVLKQKVVL